MNSFKELENNQVRLFAEARSKRVYDKVNGSLGGLRFLGHIIEMYIPVMADTVASMTAGETAAFGGDTDQENNHAAAEHNDPTKDNDRPPTGPGAGTDGLPLIR